MDDTDYDAAARHLARRGDAAMMHWLLQLDRAHLRFDGWLDPVLLWPGLKERVCDAIARLADLNKGGMPCASILEFQTTPDPRMFGRLLVAGGLCWLDVKPVDLPGDRFELCAVEVNLTGQGDCARHMTLGTTEWKLTPRELNLETLDAAGVLEDVAAETAPRELLAWISLMKNGANPATIARWLEIAGSETDPDRRGDSALVALFAGAVGRRELWHKALEEFSMNESPVAREWRAEARREGELKGELKGKAEALVLALEERFGTLALDLLTQIRASTQNEQLDRWVRLAVSPSVATLEQFRQRANL